MFDTGHFFEWFAVDFDAGTGVVCDSHHYICVALHIICTDFFKGFFFCQVLQHLVTSRHKINIVCEMKDEDRCTTIKDISVGGFAV